jgi:hypothetical protein
MSTTDEHATNMAVVTRLGRLREPCAISRKFPFPFGLVTHNSGKAENAAGGGCWPAWLGAGGKSSLIIIGPTKAPRQTIDSIKLPYKLLIE